MVDRLIGIIGGKMSEDSATYTVAATACKGNTNTGKQGRKMSRHERLYLMIRGDIPMEHESHNKPGATVFTSENIPGFFETLGGKDAEYITRNEVAALFRVSPMTTYRWVRSGILPPAIRIGRYSLWKKADILKLIKEAEKRTGEE